MTEGQPGHQPTIMVSKLPFLHSAGFPPEQNHVVDRLVFAPQAKVPAEQSERESILLALEQASKLNPELEVVIKLRAKAGEPQTHLEAFPYDSLFTKLQSEHRISKDSQLRFDTGSMSEALAAGSALVTVSSTAALESLDRGLPTLILSDFGVSAQMINTVFTASGVIGTLDDVVGLNFGEPNKAWLRENYFHRVDHSFIHARGAAQRARAGKLVNRSADAGFYPSPAIAPSTENHFAFASSQSIGEVATLFQASTQKWCKFIVMSKTRFIHEGHSNALQQNQS